MGQVIPVWEGTVESVSFQGMPGLLPESIELSQGRRDYDHESVFVEAFQVESNWG